MYILSMYSIDKSQEKLPGDWKIVSILLVQYKSICNFYQNFSLVPQWKLNFFFFLFSRTRGVCLFMAIVVSSKVASVMERIVLSPMRWLKCKFNYTRDVVRMVDRDRKIWWTLKDGRSSVPVLAAQKPVPLDATCNFVADAVFLLVQINLLPSTRPRN